MRRAPLAPLICRHPHTYHPFHPFAILPLRRHHTSLHSLIAPALHHAITPSPDCSITSFRNYTITTPLHYPIPSYSITPLRPHPIPLHARLPLRPVLLLRSERARLSGRLGSRVRQRVRGKMGVLDLVGCRGVHARTGGWRLHYGRVGGLPLSRRPDRCSRAYGYIELAIARDGARRSRALPAASRPASRRSCHVVSRAMRHGWYVLSTDLAIWRAAGDRRRPAGAHHVADGRDADAAHPASGSRRRRRPAAGASPCSTPSTPPAPRWDAF